MIIFLKDIGSYQSRRNRCPAGTVCTQGHSYAVLPPAGHLGPSTLTLAAPGIWDSRFTPCSLTVPSPEVSDSISWPPRPWDDAFTCHKAFQFGWDIQQLSPGPVLKHVYLREEWEKINWFFVVVVQMNNIPLDWLSPWIGYFQINQMKIIIKCEVPCSISGQASI